MLRTRPCPPHTSEAGRRHKSLIDTGNQDVIDAGKQTCCYFNSATEVMKTYTPRPTSHRQVWGLFSLSQEDSYSYWHLQQQQTTLRGVIIGMGFTTSYKRYLCLTTTIFFLSTERSTYLAGSRGWIETWAKGGVHYRKTCNNNVSNIVLRILAFRQALMGL